MCNKENEQCQKGKINKIDKLLDRLLIRERKRNEKGDIISNSIDIQNKKKGIVDDFMLLYLEI